MRFVHPSSGRRVCSLDDPLTGGRYYFSESHWRFELNGFEGGRRVFSLTEQDPDRLFIFPGPPAPPFFDNLSLFS